MSKVLVKLMNIQNELVAPKGQYNSFSKFNYRSAEDILEAVKPLLHQNKAVLSVSDEIELIGDRYYIKAVATFLDTESDESHSVTAYAREEERKKGMDASQITGSTSSYARKYALNGLFAIDDNKDADTRDNREVKPQKEPMGKPKAIKFIPPTDDQVTELHYLLGEDRTNAMLKYHKVDFISEIDKRQVEKYIKAEINKQSSLDDL